MSGPSFHAWCSEAVKLDAFIASISALVASDAKCDVDPWSSRAHGDLSLAECITAVQSNYQQQSHVTVWADACIPRGHRFSMRFECYGASYEGRSPPDCLLGGDMPWFARVGNTITLDVPVLLYERSWPAEAAYFAGVQQAITDDVLLRICAPDESNRVITGGLSSGYQWYAPLEIAGTYNLDGNITRDIALSWMYIHEGAKIERVAGLSVEELAARIDAAPKGTRIGIATNVKHVWGHLARDQEATNTKFRSSPPDAIRHGPRKILPTDVELTREEVLAILQIPPVAIVDAMEAAALPDPEWCEAEAIAREMIAAKDRGDQTVEIRWPDGTHAHFLEQHAPFHVRRLPNGGVMLATHPYRTLWPLWADALALLGIRS